MKNSNVFPFQRNRYFYGKLLSVDDFELEQRYMNDKRRLVNRYLFGPGIVTGLYVVDVDEQTVSVEAGFALDSWGREVVVDKPVLKKLSLIDGYDHCVESNSDVLYLCMEYDEEEAEPVHNISGTVAGERDGENSCARVRESYRLFLTELEPEEQEKSSLSPGGMVRQSVRVWQDDDVKITQSVKRFMRTGTQTELIVQIENRGRSTLAFSYDIVLNGLSAEGGGSRLTVNFDEMMVERTGSYELRFPLSVSGVVGDQAVMTVDPESVSYKISGAVSDATFEGVTESEIIDIPEIEALEQAYYRMPMEKVAVQGYQSPIYLARINLVSGADTYVIEHVENAPFGQYVTNSMLETAKASLREYPAGAGLSAAGAEPRPVTGGAVQNSEQPVRIAQGMAEIVIKGGGQRGDKFFSQAITHGLGLGRVTVILGLERNSGKVVYGSGEIFENKEDPGTDAELAASVNAEDGSFVIGARLLSGVKGGRIRVHWTALRDATDMADSRNEKRIFIKPNLLEMAVRDSHRLEAICENMVEKTVSWSVREGGGFIDETGLYTAPNQPGVSEVVARSVAFPDVKASIFVVVRGE